MTQPYPELLGRWAELKKEWEAIPFWRLLGMEATGLDEGRCRIRLGVRPDLLAPGDVLHGGFYGCLIDTAVGSALKCYRELDRPEV
ncbi:MAG TPA: PaaI family thioesterase, partial [Dehalococcoidia bacterium]|nr:PaaI family thioesterase [Dehalococcoidia bacterium]